MQCGLCLETLSKTWTLHLARLINSLDKNIDVFYTGKPIESEILWEFIYWKSP